MRITSPVSDRPHWEQLGRKLVPYLREPIKSSKIADLGRLFGSERLGPELALNALAWLEGEGLAFERVGQWELTRIGRVYDWMHTRELRPELELHEDEPVLVYGPVLLARGSRWEPLYAIPCRTDSYRNATGSWMCRCACGAERAVPVRKLSNGASKSCGCRRKNIRAIRAGVDA